MASTPANLLRIVTRGVQDISRLNSPAGQPSVSHYSSVLRHCTRWASRWERVDFDNLADFGRSAIVTLPLLGDLITRATLVVELPTDISGMWTNSIGHAMCSQITMLIGGATIDTLDSRLLEVLDEQTQSVEHFDTTNALIGRNPNGGPPSLLRAAVIPPFWWNRGIGPQAFPIGALAKDRVQIQVAFRPIQELLVPSQTLPAHFRDAYWIVEYVTLEDRESAAFRLADLTIPIEQHVAVPVHRATGSSVRIPLPQGGLVRDMTWVLQRPEAAALNAYFLFGRDCFDASGEILWPNVDIPGGWDYGNGFYRPTNRGKDPITGAALFYHGVQRFDHEGPSMFRSLIPALNCARTPIVNRYIYRYDFGFWPTGGLASDLCRDEIRGAANWDLIQKRELVLEINRAGLPVPPWVPTGESRTYSVLGDLTADFADASGLSVLLSGACPHSDPTENGAGATLQCTVDCAQIRRLPGFRRLLVRPVTNGSASLIADCGTGFVWLAVAGAGGFGTTGFVGGDAAAACEISFQGGGGLQTQDASGGCGGGGGGKVGTPGPGLPDGGVAANDAAFVYDCVLHSTGGTTQTYAGGDGYFGGGSGARCGGGGGGYISSLVSAVTTVGGMNVGSSSIVVTPLARAVTTVPEFDVYVWLTRLNLLRIASGRGGLMFSD